jgi:hypothetical protein
MSLVFPNVSLLGLSQESRFFDAGFHYSTTKNINIQGLVIDLTNSFGISGIWTGQEGITKVIQSAQDYQNLILNGVSFGSGKINSISFSPGLDVRTKTYNASLIIQDSGNLFNLTGFFYSGINLSQFQYLEDFSEDYSFQKKQNGGYSYTHNANIQFSSGIGQLNAIAAAQALARTLFTGSNLGLAFYSGYTNKQGKRYFSENYNLITNNCSFEETFDFDKDCGPYSAIYTVNVDRDERGVTTATEQATLRGIENPNYQKALTAIEIEMTGSYYRCSGAANYYFPSGAILINSPVSQGRNIDIFNNNIGYTIIFNNDTTNSGNFFWDYTIQTTLTEGIGNVSENGTVIGKGENHASAFVSAQNGFLAIKSGMSSRINDTFVNVFGSATNYLENKQETFSPFQGICGYTYNFTNNPNLISNSGIRRKTVSIQENAVRYAYNKLNILGYKEIVQNDRQSTVGQTTVSVELEGDKTVTLPLYLSTAVTEINLNLPVGNDKYVADASYEYDKNNGKVNVILTWLYNRAAVPTIYPNA